MINNAKTRAYQNQTRKTEEKSEPQTQQSSLISNTPQNRLKIDQLPSEQSKISENNSRNSPRPANTLARNFQK